MRKGAHTIDLGAGSGALAFRLLALGCDVTAVDLDQRGFKADVPFIAMHLDDASFAVRLGEAQFDLVTAIEVIEHIESPLAFLRNVKRMLKPDGKAILTTPNVDNVPDRVKFLATGKLRMMDERGDPTHISPMFWDLFTRQYLPRAGLKLVEHFVYPLDGYLVTRPFFAWTLRTVAQFLRGPTLLGDNHVFVLQPQR